MENNRSLKEIIVVHYHHNIRKTAEKDEVFVRGYAHEMTYVGACRIV